MDKRLKRLLVFLCILLQSCAHPRFIGVLFPPLPFIREFIEYETENETKEIENIISIKQYIGHNHPRFSLGFFSYKEKWDKPYKYEMIIETPGPELSKVKINLIKIAANGEEHTIDISTIELEEARFSFTNDWSDTMALTDLLKETISNELSFRISLPSWYDIDYIKEIDYYSIYFFDIPIDHKKMKSLTLTYNLDYELLNGEKYNIEESVIYKRYHYKK